MDERAEAIELLYRERYGRFRDGVATITGDRESARDVVQEAFARALRKRRSFRGRCTSPTVTRYSPKRFARYRRSGG